MTAAASTKTDAGAISTAAPPRRPVAVVLLSGLAGGFALGVLARAWMRAISEDPDFTWEGTGFIVVGFTLFGLAQSAAAAGRQRHVRRGALTALRVLGGIFMLPLFGAAGALMAPTVIGGSLARFRVDWRPVARMLCAVVAAAPVAFVTVDLVRTFAISMQTIVGIAGLLGVYATVIQMAGATLAPAPNPQRLSRRARWAIGATLLALFLVPLVVGGVK